MDNKKIIGIVLILLILIVGLYQFVYVPYNNEQSEINFNKGLIKASQIQNNTSRYEQYNSNSTDISQATSDMNNMYKEMKPHVQEVRDVLNDTLNYANNNETKKKYLELQIKRLDSEERAVDHMIETINEMETAYNNNDYALVLDLSGKFADKTNRDNNEYKSIQSDVKTLLKENPDFDASIRALNLTEDFYGEVNETSFNTTI